MRRSVSSRRSSTTVTSSLWNLMQSSLMADSRSGMLTRRYKKQLNKVQLSPDILFKILNHINKKWNREKYRTVPCLWGPFPLGSVHMWSSYGWLDQAWARKNKWNYVGPSGEDVPLYSKKTACFYATRLDSIIVCTVYRSSIRTDWKTTIFRCMYHWTYFSPLSIVSIGCCFFTYCFSADDSYSNVVGFHSLTAKLLPRWQLNKYCIFVTFNKFVTLRLKLITWLIILDCFSLKITYVSPSKHGGFSHIFQHRKGRMQYII